MNTDLPLKQVCITPPNLPVHNPFLDWAPESVALTPTDTVGPISAPAPIEGVNEEIEIEDESADGGARESSVEQSVSPLPFRMGPTPPLVQAIQPVGKVRGGYPRGDPTKMKRTSTNFRVYSGPEMYAWPQVVSISSLLNISILIFWSIQL